MKGKRSPPMKGKAAVDVGAVEEALEVVEMDAIDGATVSHKPPAPVPSLLLLTTGWTLVIRELAGLPAGGGGGQGQLVRSPARLARVSIFFASAVDRCSAAKHLLTLEDYLRLAPGKRPLSCLCSPYHLISPAMDS